MTVFLTGHWALSLWGQVSLLFPCPSFSAPFSTSCHMPFPNFQEPRTSLNVLWTSEILLGLWAKYAPALLLSSFLLHNPPSLQVTTRGHEAEWLTDGLAPLGAFALCGIISLQECFSDWSHGKQHGKVKPSRQQVGVLLPQKLSASGTAPGFWCLIL